MITDVPVYFPFTYIEPERAGKLSDYIGKFKTYRVFEKNVSDELAGLEADDRIICDVFRLSSDDSVKIAHRFLDWSKNRESLDIKAVAAFFNYMDSSNEPVDIMGSIDAIDNYSGDSPAFNELLLRQEITLFLIQLLDRQEYEINRAFRRISQNHKRLFVDPETQLKDSSDNSSFDLSGFRLNNMTSRVVSWLSAFLFLSEKSRIIFTDEKEAFMVFTEFFKNDGIKLYKINKDKSGLSRSDLMRLALTDNENNKFDPDFFELLENGKQLTEKPGDLFFAASDPASFRKVVLGALGIRYESFTEYALLSDDCIFPIVCFVA